MFQMYCSFCSHTWSRVPQLERGCGFLPGILLQSPHPCSPTFPPAPGHLANSCLLSLSEVLLLACSLIKYLQRPLNAYTPSPNLSACLSKAFIIYCLCAPSILGPTVSPDDPTCMTDLPTAQDTLHVYPASTLCGKLFLCPE